MRDLAGSSISKPPSRNEFVLRQNSRVVSASEPPGDSEIMQRSKLPSSNNVDPCQTHVLAVPVVGGGSASMSRTVSHDTSLPL